MKIRITEIESIIEYLVIAQNRIHLVVSDDLEICRNYVATYVGWYRIYPL